MKNPKKYDESSIKSLDWKQHIRKRPGMYIGKTGNGSSPDDGIYILIKEVLDNSIDEHIMGFGNKIVVKRSENIISIRDFGRGIPLGKVEDCVSKINTGGKYDSEVFKKSVGLNGVGIKVLMHYLKNLRLNPLEINKKYVLIFQKVIKNISKITSSNELNGTYVEFLMMKLFLKSINILTNL